MIDYMKRPGINVDVEDETEEQRKKDLEAGNRASKRQEATRRLIAKQGEAILDSPDIEKMVDEEVERMSQLAQIPEPTAKNHNVHESVANSEDNKVKGDQIPGQTTEAQNTQNQNVSASGPNTPAENTTTPEAARKPGESTENHQVGANKTTRDKQNK